jgi:hypothetical protein
VELRSNFFFSKEMLLGLSLVAGFFFFFFFFFFFPNLHVSCDKEILALWAVIARRIWLRRNSVVHNGSFIHPNMVYREAFLAYEEFKTCNMEEAQPVPTLRDIATDGLNVWKPPPEGVIKIN